MTCSCSSVCGVQHVSTFLIVSLNPSKHEHFVDFLYVPQVISNPALMSNMWATNGYDIMKKQFIDNEKK